MTGVGLVITLLGIIVTAGVWVWAFREWADTIAVVHTLEDYRRLPRPIAPHVYEERGVGATRPSVVVAASDAAEALGTSWRAAGSASVASGAVAPGKGQVNSSTRTCAVDDGTLLSVYWRQHADTVALLRSEVDA
jgi:hypothetical protein